MRLRTERGQRSDGPGGGHFGGPGIGLHSHGSGGGGRLAPGEIDDTKLYVAGLTAHATEEPLRALFGRWVKAWESRGGGGRLCGCGGCAGAHAERWPAGL